MLEVIEPATERTLATVRRAGVEEADAAVARARAAYPAWRAVAPADRARLLGRLSTVVEEHAEELAVMEARNAGKPISDARGEMGMVADVFRYYAGAPERLLGDTIPVAGGHAFTVREPLGVVGLIVPWNFPVGAAETIKRVTLELGGKSANVVFADADLEAAAAAAPGAVFGNAGQDCCARSRILVEARALDDFMAALEPAVRAVRVGDPLDEST